MRLGKTTIIHFGSQIVVSVAGFAATFAIAIGLGGEALGRYSVAVALGFYWLVVPGNAIGTAVRKRMSEGDDPRGFFGSGLAVNGALAAVTAVAVFAAGELLPLVVDTASREFFFVLSRYNLEVSLLVVGSLLFKTIRDGLDGQKRVDRSGFVTALERVVRTLVQVAVVLVGFGVTSLIGGHVLALLVAAVVGLVLADVKPALPSRERIASLLSFARYAWMSVLRSRVFGWMDTLVLSFFVGATLIGIYEAAWGVGSLLAAASVSIRQTLFPEVSDLSTGGNEEHIRHYLDEGLVFAGVLIIPGLLGAAVIGDRILAFYRPNFAQGADVLVILVAAYAIEVYGGQFLSVINAVDAPDRAYRINAAFITTNLVLNVVLVWQIGWYGAAVATAISAFLRAVLGYRVLTDLIGRPSVPVREIGLEVVAAGVMALLVLPLRPMVPAGRLWTLLLVGFGAVVYVTVLLALSTRVRRKVVSFAPSSVA